MISRATLLRTMAAPWPLALLAAAAVLGSRLRGRLVLERVALPVPDLPPALDGLRLLHLSDLHLRATDGDLADEVRAFSALRPDLTVVTGDLIEDDAGIPLAASLVRDLAGRDSTFVVLGNHDYIRYGFGGQKMTSFRNDVPRLCAALAQAGATVLRNAWATAQPRGTALHVVGVDDPHLGYDALDVATAGLPADGPRLLLSHSPDILPQAVAHGLRVVIAGHTHGGQVVLPLLGAVKTATRLRLPRPAGLLRWRSATIYVSRGVHGALPIRFNCPPEVGLLTLRPADAPRDALSRCAGTPSPNLI
ncbi:MAG: metallophosphoesterase [Chloroflexi bacterium]|nr:metallophosphoesterase [Chloroflexota bacterium]